jgi:hypothetical protein
MYFVDTFHKDIVIVFLVMTVLLASVQYVLKVAIIAVHAFLREFWPIKLVVSIHLHGMP